MRFQLLLWLLFLVEQVWAQGNGSAMLRLEFGQDGSVQARLVGFGAARDLALAERLGMTAQCRWQAGSNGRGWNGDCRGLLQQVGDGAYRGVLPLRAWQDAAAQAGLRNLSVTAKFPPSMMVEARQANQKEVFEVKRGSVSASLRASGPAVQDVRVRMGFSRAEVAAVAGGIAGFLLVPALALWWWRRGAEAAYAQGGGDIAHGCEVVIGILPLFAFLCWINLFLVAGAGYLTYNDNGVWDVLAWAALASVPPLVAWPLWAGVLASWYERMFAEKMRSGEGREFLGIAAAVFGIALLFSALLHGWRAQYVLMAIALGFTITMHVWMRRKKSSGEAEGNELRDGDLRERLLAMAEGAKVTLRSIRVVEVGEQMRSRLAERNAGVAFVAPGLAAGLNNREERALLAHEIGYFKTRDMHAISICVWFAAAAWFQGWMVVWRMNPDAAWSGWLAAFQVAVWPLLVIAAAAAAARWAEHSTDARAVKLTGDAEGLVAVFEKLAALRATPREWPKGVGMFAWGPSVADRAARLVGAGRG